MKTSQDRIITTHVGSLPRPDNVLAQIAAVREGKPLDQSVIAAAVRDCLKKQASVGLDVVNDGEFSKPSFLMYIESRLSGFELTEATPEWGLWSNSKEGRAFPEFYATQPPPRSTRMNCTGAVKYIGQKAIEADIGNLRAALKGVKFEEAFIPSISPTNVTALHSNSFYATKEEYDIAVADAVRVEYEAILDAGFILQIDDPHLMTHYGKVGDLTLQDARKWAAYRVDVLNHALRGLPQNRVRFHTCAGINMGPRVNDMPLESMIDILLRVNAGAYSFEYGNPRHEHEWKVWKTSGLPEDKILIPGVITNSTVLVEHPELVADRIERFASVVGRERVIPGADCGFASSATKREIPESIVWEKFKSLVRGAEIASKRLWSRPVAA